MEQLFNTWNPRPLTLAAGYCCPDQQYQLPKLRCPGQHGKNTLLIVTWQRRERPTWPPQKGHGLYGFPYNLPQASRERRMRNPHKTVDSANLARIDGPKAFQRHMCLSSVPSAPSKLSHNSPASRLNTDGIGIQGAQPSNVQSFSGMLNIGFGVGKLNSWPSWTQKRAQGLHSSSLFPAAVKRRRCVLPGRPTA